MPEQILVVDDDPALLQVLTRFLQGQGFAVEAHQRGETALAAVEQQEPAVALLDLNLPDLSGLEVMRRLKATRPDTEVILFTGLGGLDSAVAALRLGAYDYLVKSELKLPELAAVVERALERRHLTRANRELVEDLKQAREALAQRRAQELVQIRRIGERLAGPLTLEGLTQGLADLIWESLPLSCLSLTIRGPGGEVREEAERLRQPSPHQLAAWKEWCRGFLTRGGDPDPPPPGWAVVWGTLSADPLRGLAAGGRPTPFEPEETELFRIFLLQGEAALRNLLLFEEVKGLAIRDGLTGLYNYRYFREMLTQQVGQSRRYGWPLSLLFVDLDDFKVVNDTLGHPAGDVVLKTVAGYLRRAVRAADLLCRYGGEEFVILLPQTPPEQAEILANRLRAGIAGLSIPLPERELFVTVSIGVAALTPGADGDALVAAADQALYRAKEGGKNRVCRA